MIFPRQKDLPPPVSPGCTWLINRPWITQSPRFCDPSPTEHSPPAALPEPTASLRFSTVFFFLNPENKAMILHIHLKSKMLRLNTHEEIAASPSPSPASFRLLLPSTARSRSPGRGEARAGLFHSQTSEPRLRSSLHCASILQGCFR